MDRFPARLSIIESLEHRLLLSAGQLDSTFGSGGKVTVDFGGPSVGSSAVAIQGDGKTVVAGTAISGGVSSVALARLNFDGSLDTTFGANHNGIVIQHVGNPDSQNAISAVAIDSAGEILVAGGEDGDFGSFLVMRFRANGTLDTSWAGGGVRGIGFGTFTFGSAATAMTIQSDGKIVIVGDSFPRFSNQEFAIWRLNPNGTNDNSFGDSSQQTVVFPDDAQAQAVTIDYSGTAKTNPNYGCILVSGEDIGDVDKMAVARLRPNGSLDASFHAGGEFFFAPPNLNYADSSALAIQSNGDILVCGTAGIVTSGFGLQDQIFAMTRLTPKGLLDSSFASGHTWAMIGFGGNSIATSLLIGQNGRLIVGGFVSTQMAIAAFTANGGLDSTFATNGRLTLNFGDGVADLAYGPGNRFVATGGGKFNTVRILDTGARLVHVQSLTGTSIASEVGPTPATFFVFREERLPVSTRVFFSVGGTAAAPTFSSIRNKSNDYSLDGMTFPFVVLGGGSTPFVDIPANQTFAIVTLTPIDRKAGDGNKTATFTIKSDASYGIEAPSSMSVKILDKVGQQTVLKPTADAFVRDGASANTNFGSSAQLNVKTDTANSGLNRRAFLKFDISSIANINSVKLQLFGNLSTTASSNVSAGVFAVADTSWSEGGITWNNQPAIGANLASTTILDTTPRLYTWDITAYVKAQKAAGHNTITLAIKNLGTSSNFDIFNSREAASNQPQLVIT